MSERTLQDEFSAKYAEELKKIGKRPNILICGYTGTGKTSLIKAILGDIVPETAIGAGAPKTVGFDHYENELVSIWDSQGFEAGQTDEEFLAKTRAFLRERQNDPNVDNHIHLIWYTISRPGGRVTPCDKKMITEIFNPADVIIVMTKDDMPERPNQKDAMKKEALSTGISEKRLIFTSDEYAGAKGCRELMMLSYEMLPDAYKDAFMEAQRIDIEAKVNAVEAKKIKAWGIIGGASSAAAAIGAVPIPFSDAPALMAVQTSMIAGLAVLYGLKEEAVKQAALPFLAKAAGLMAASSLSKLLPGLGSVISATVASSLTMAMGWFCQQHFEKVAIAKIKGEPLPELNFDFNAFKTMFEEYEKQGQGKAIK